MVTILQAVDIKTLMRISVGRARDRNVRELS